MAGLKSVGGIVIPIMVVRKGDKATIARIKAELNSLNTVMSKTGKNKMGGMNGAIGALKNVRWAILDAMFLIRAFAAIGGAFINQWKSAAEYQKQLVMIQNVSGKTTEDLKNMTTSLQASSEFSLKDVTDSFLLVSRSGFEASEAVDVMDASMKMARLSGMDLEASTSTMTQLLKQFNIEADDSSSVLDSLSSTADSTRSSVETLGKALSYVGAVAAGAGQELDSTINILAQLQEAGLNSTKAGTSLRQILSALSDPTAASRNAMDQLRISFVDTSGEIKDVAVFIQELSYALKDLDDGTKQELLGKMFNVRSIAGVQALLNKLEDNNSALTEFAESTDVAGAAMVKNMNLAATASVQYEASLEAIKSGWKSLGEGNGLSWVRNFTDSIAMMLQGGNSDTELRFHTKYADSSTKSLLKDLKRNKGVDEGQILIRTHWTVEGPAIYSREEADELVADIREQAEAAKTFIESMGDSKSTLSEELNKLIILGKDRTEEELKYSALLATNPELMDDLITRYGDVGVAAAALSAKTTALDDQRIAKMKEIEDLDKEIRRVSTDETDEARFEKVVLLKARQLQLSRDAVDIQVQLNEVSSQYTTNMSRATAEMADLYSLQQQVITGAQAFVNLGDAIHKALGLDKLTPQYDKLIGLVTTAGDELNDMVTSNTQSGGDFAQENANLMLYKTTISEAAEEIKGLEEANRDLEDSVASVKLEIKDQTDIISGLKNEISDVDDVISNLIGRRYTNESAVINLLEQASLYGKKQELATLGVADAQQFVNDAVEGGIDDYDNYFEKIQSINNEMGNNKNAFKAWQETIKTAIGAEVQAGVELEADVSNRVKQWQTQLMGISSFTGETESSGVDAFVNKLQLASDVTFGGMRAEVDNFVREQEDRDNGLNTSATEVITALTTQYAVLGSLNEQLGASETALSGFEEELADYTLQIADNNTLISEKHEIMKTSLDNASTALVNFTNRVNDARVKSIDNTRRARGQASVADEEAAQQSLPSNHSAQSYDNRQSNQYDYTAWNVYKLT